MRELILLRHAHAEPADLGQDDIDRALSRQGVEERFESFGADLQAQMRAGFLSLAKEFKERFVVINGARSIDEVSVDVCQTVDDHLAKQ